MGKTEFYDPLKATLDERRGCRRTMVQGFMILKIQAPEQRLGVQGAGLMGEGRGTRVQAWQ